MMASFASLGHRDALVIAGDAARGFLQGQLSGDLRQLQPGRWQWNAWLDPRGRVCALLHLADPGDGRLLAVLRGGDAAGFAAELGRFRLRARVAINPVRFAALAGPAREPGLAVPTDDGFQLGYGERSLHLSRAQPTAADPGAANAFALADIHAGWPTLPAAEPALLAPALSLERLGAVAFDKGCYRGQEIAARLHWRGGHKYRLARLQGIKELPAAGTVCGATTALAKAFSVAVDGSRVWQGLAVIPITSSNEINIMGNTYTIESRFDA